MMAITCLFSPYKQYVMYHGVVGQMLSCITVGKDAQALNRQYTRKISALEGEAEQARQEVQEAQRQLQDLEKQEKETSGVTDRTRAQECRRKIAAAQSKVQVCLSESDSYTNACCTLVTSVSVSAHSGCLYLPVSVCSYMCVCVRVRS